MKQYYYEKLEKATLKLALARVGYERDMKVLASKLEMAEESMHGPIIKQMCELRSVLDEMIEEAKDYKAKWQEECEKEGAVNAEVCE